MSKISIISGYKAGYVKPTAPAMSDERYAQVEANMPYCWSMVGRGWWSDGAALDRARRSGVVGPVSVVHRMLDSSGKGRSYTHAERTVDDVQIAA